MAQIPNLQTPNIESTPISSSSIRSRENPEVANHRGTERRFSSARSGDDDRAKPRQPFGQHLTIPVNLFNSKALYIICHEAVVRMTAVSRSCEDQKPL